MVLICLYERQKLNLDLSNSILDSYIEVCPVNNVYQGTFRVSPCCCCHGFVRSQHCHLQTQKLFIILSTFCVKHPDINKNKINR